MQEETFVCQHLVQTLRDAQPRGFFWANPSSQRRPDAWCTTCNERVAAAGGEWSASVLDEARVKLLCASCYDEVACLNGFTSPAA
jgi:hypothetical protein